MGKRRRLSEVFHKNEEQKCIQYINFKKTHAGVVYRCQHHMLHGKGRDEREKTRAIYKDAASRISPVARYPVNSPYIFRTTPPSGS